MHFGKCLWNPLTLIARFIVPCSLCKFATNSNAKLIIRQSQTLPP